MITIRRFRGAYLAQAILETKNLMSVMAGTPESALKLLTKKLIKMSQDCENEALQAVWVLHSENGIILEKPEKKENPPVTRLRKKDSE